MRTYAPIRERLWGRCEVQGECLVYRGGTSKQGYGLLYYNGRNRGAHRVALALAGEIIKPGQYVLHSCDNPPCCNPNHLRAGSPRDNVDDAMKRGRTRAPRGEQHHRAKLTPDDVRQIRCIDGPGYKRIARLYGVRWRAIQKIRKGERWRDVGNVDPTVAESA